MFEVDSPLCIVSTYTIVQKSGTTYSPYTGTDVKIDELNSIVISTAAAMSKNLYV